MIGLGLRLEWLGTEALSWRDLKVITRNLPPGSALGRAMHPDSHAWGLTEQLLASAVDALAGANWQRANGKGPRPTPIPRPGVGPVKKQYGGADAVPIDEMNRFLGWEVSDG